MGAAHPRTKLIENPTVDWRQRGSRGRSRVDRGRRGNDQPQQQRTDKRTRDRDFNLPF
jgi:hypothetical protein